MTSATFVFVSITPTETYKKPNEEFIISYSVTNQGDVSGTCQVQLYDHVGSLIRYNEHIIDVGATIDASFTVYAPSEVGDYTWLIKAYNVDVGTVDDTGSIIIHVVAGSFQFIDVSPTSFEIEYGQSVTVNYSFTNVGNSSGNCQVRVVDEEGSVVEYKSYSDVPVSGTVSDSITFYGPIVYGTHVWSLELYNTDTDRVDDKEDLTIFVHAPHFDILSYSPTSVTGTVGQSFRINYRVQNVGDRPGTVRMQVVDEYGTVITSLLHTLDPDYMVDYYLDLRLPSTPGTYTWFLQAINNNTSHLDDQGTIILQVTPPIVSISESIVGTVDVYGYVREKEYITISESPQGVVYVYADITERTYPPSLPPTLVDILMTTITSFMNFMVLIMIFTIISRLMREVIYSIFRY